MSEEIQIYRFNTLDDKSILKKFLEIKGDYIYIIFGTSLFLAMIYISAELYFLLIWILLMILIPFHFYLKIKNRSKKYIRTIEVNPHDQTLVLEINDRFKSKKITLKFGTYSLIRRKAFDYPFDSHFEINTIKPFKTQFKQYLLGDWENDEGYDILSKYSKNALSQKYTPYGKDKNIVE